MLAAVTVWVALAATPSPTHSPPSVPAQSSNITVTDSSGHVLRGDPVIRRGTVLYVSASGFSAAEKVDVDPTVDHWAASPIVADDTGRVRFRFTVPLSIANGQYEVVLVGEDPPTGPATEPTLTATAGDVQVIEAGVPHNAGFPFRATDPGGPTTGSSGSSSGGAGGRGSGSGGHLGFTGSDVLAALELAVALLGIGTAVIWVARGRRGNYARGARSSGGVSAP